MGMFLIFNPSFIADKHVGYVLYSIAILIVLLAIYLWFLIKAGK